MKISKNDIIASSLVVINFIGLLLCVIYPDISDSWILSQAFMIVTSLLIFNSINEFVDSESHLKFILNLTICALMMLGTQFLLDHLYDSNIIFRYDNVFIILLLGYGMLMFLFDPHEWQFRICWQIRMLIGIAFGYLMTVYTECGYIYLILFLTFFLFHNYCGIRDAAILILSFVIFTLNIRFIYDWSSLFTIFTSNSQWLIVAVIPLLHLYSDRTSLQ